MNIFRLLASVVGTWMLVLGVSCSESQPQWFQVKINDINEDISYLNCTPANECNLIGLQAYPYSDTNGKKSSDFGLYKINETDGYVKLPLAKVSGSMPVPLILSDHELLISERLYSEAFKPYSFSLYNSISDNAIQFGQYSQVGVPNPSYTVVYSNGVLYLIAVEDASLRCYDVTKKQPKQIQNLENVSCSVRGFINGVLTFVAITTANETYVFDANKASFTRSTNLDWLTAVLKLNPEPNRKISGKRFAFANDIATLVTHDELILFDSKGNSSKIKILDAVAYSPSGRKRSQEEYQRLIKDPLSIRSERVGLGTKAIGACQVLPLNNQQIAVFDRDYQRFLLFSHN